MRNYFIFIFFTVPFLFLSSCSTQENENLVAFSIAYYKDIPQKETIESVVHKKFIPLENQNLGNENGTYWIKIECKDSLKNLENLVFDVQMSTVKTIEVFNQTKKIPYLLLEKSPQKIRVPTNNNQIYFLKLSFDKHVFFDMEIEKYEESQLNAKYDFFKQGAYYGFVLMVFIINLFFFFSLKDKSFLFYSLFLLSISFCFSTYDGMIYLIMSEENAFYINGIFHFSVAFFGVFFANHFLDLKNFNPKSYIIRNILLALSAVSFLLFYVTEKSIFISLGDTFGLITVFYYWLLGVAIFKKHEFAKFFVLGYSLILFFGILFVIPLNWKINMPFVSLNTMKFGSIFEMLILSYAITYRTKTLQNENDKYKSEIKKHLKKNEIINLNSIEKFEIEKENLLKNFNLSERELDVLLLIAKGLTNKKIAEDLYISLNTVKYHIRNIYEKLNIKSKNEVLEIFSETKTT